MVDISKTVEAKSDQLNAEDLIGGPRTIEITDVRGHDSAEQPVSIHYAGDRGKPYKPCKTMRRALLNIWGEDGLAYIGRRLTLYLDPSVKFGGMQVGGIRISHASHLDGPRSLMLTQTRGKKAETIIQPLPADETEAVILRAKEEAAKGTEAFRQFLATRWAKERRGIIEPRLDDFRKICAEADDAGKTLAQKMAERAGKDENSETEVSADAEQAQKAAEATTEEWTFDTGAVDPFSDDYTAGQEAFKAGQPETAAPREDQSAWNNWIGGWRFEQGQAS